MRIGRWTRLLLAAAPLLAGFLAGCGDFWQAPSTTTPTCTTNCTTLSSDNFYILNGGTTSQVAGYSIVSGTLTALTNSPYSVTGAASAIAVDPTGSFLYVASTAGIYLYTINSSTGALTQGSAIYQDAVSAALQVDPAGAWLLDASAQGTLIAIPITSTGAFDSTRLPSGSPLPSQPLAATTVQQMAISSNGHVAVALGSAGTQAFSFTTGNAAPLGKGSNAIKPTNKSAGAAVAVAVDPQNRFLYIGETVAFPSSTTNSGGLRIFAISGNTLTEPTTSPYPSGGTGPHSILPKSTGDYVYVANWAGTSAGNVTGFQVVTSGSTPALTVQSGTVATGNEPSGLAEEGKLSFVLAVSSGGSPVFDAYIFDTTTAGQLDFALTGSTGTGPVAIVAQ
jgi:6-phosphogluconolactonase